MSIQTDAAGAALSSRRARRTSAAASGDGPETASSGTFESSERDRPHPDVPLDAPRPRPKPRHRSRPRHAQARRGAFQRRREPGRSRPPRVSRRLRGSSLRRGIQRLRIPLALLLGVCAVGAGILAGAETQTETTAAVRAASPVAAGQELTVADLEEVQVDVGAVPEGHPAGTEDLLGRRTAVPLPAGALVHEAHLVGPGLLEGQGRGVVAVPVRPADTAMVGMLTPGQRVDVLLSADSPEAGSSSRTVAEAAPVLWTPTSEDENWLPGAGEAGNVVIVAVEAETAEQIARATHEGRLHLSLVSG